MASYNRLADTDIFEISNDKKTPSPRGRYLQSLVHILRLTIINQWTLWRSPQELPKIAIYKNRFMAVLYSTIHLVPLTAAVALVSLNMGITVVTGYSISSAPGFQFGAKLLEILMQASLTSVLLGLVREQLLTEGGVPLGSLFAPLQTTNVSFLWSIEMWGSLSASSATHSKRIGLFIITFVMVVLAALVGPTGAILMIPRPQNPPGQPFLFVLDDAESLFPTTVSAGRFSMQAYFDQKSLIQQTMAQIDTFRYASISGQTTFDVQDRWGTRTAYMRYQNGYSYATMPTALVMQLFGAYNNSLISDDITLRTKFSQPVVRMKCNHNEVTPQSTYVTFGPDFKSLDHIITLEKAISLLKNGSNITSFAPPLALDPPPSSDGHAVLVLNSLESQFMMKGLDACVIDAFWRETGYNYTHKTSRAETQQVDAMFDSVVKDQSHPIILNSTLAGEFLKLWRDSRGLWGTQAQLHTDQILIAITLALTYVSPSIQTQNVWPEPQGTWFVDSLRATGVVREYGGSLRNIKLWTTTNWSDSTTLTQLPMTGEYEVYGYGPSGTEVRLSFAVFGAYCLVVLSYLSYTLVTGTVGSNWNTIGELFMLALNSKQPSHVQHASVGVRAMATYKEPVSVRVGENKSLEVAFINDPNVRHDNFRQVEPNSLY